MTKEWFSSKELAAIEGLPSTIQGINRKARIEGWKCRKRRGVQGKAVEYHIDNFPDFAKSFFHHHEPSSARVVSPVEPLQLWVSAFLLLKDEERERVTAWLINNGVKNFIQLIEQRMNLENAI